MVYQFKKTYGTLVLALIFVFYTAEGCTLGGSNSHWERVNFELPAEDFLSSHGHYRGHSPSFGGLSEWGAQSHSKATVDDASTVTSDEGEERSGSTSPNSSTFTIGDEESGEEGKEEGRPWEAIDDLILAVLGELQPLDPPAAGAGRELSRTTTSFGDDVPGEEGNERGRPCDRVDDLISAVLGEFKPFDPPAAAGAGRELSRTTTSFNLYDLQNGVPPRPASMQGVLDASERVGEDHIVGTGLDRNDDDGRLPDSRVNLREDDNGSSNGIVAGISPVEDEDGDSTDIISGDNAGASPQYMTVLSPAAKQARTLIAMKALEKAAEEEPETALQNPIKRTHLRTFSKEKYRELALNFALDNQPGRRQMAHSTGNKGGAVHPY